MCKIVRIQFILLCKKIKSTWGMKTITQMIFEKKPKWESLLKHMKRKDCRHVCNGIKSAYCRYARKFMSKRSLGGKRLLPL